MKIKPHLALLALIPAGLITFTSCSSTPTPPPNEGASSMVFVEGVPGGVMVKTIKTTATVTAIDYTTRKATLLGSDGKKFSVKVGPKAVNLEQVRVGDLVTATVTEELVVYLDDQETPGSGAAGMVALAPKDSQPAGLGVETVRLTAKIVAINTKKRTATVEFEDGTVRTLPVRPDVDLSQRKIGEQVVFHITEMIALSVEKP